MQFLSEEQVKQLESGTTPPAGDVGVDLTRQYYLRIIAARDGSPAQKAGLRTADTIRAIDGKPTRDTPALLARIAELPPGSTVTVKVWRAKKLQGVDVVVGRRPAAQ